MITAFITTKWPILIDKGFWSMAQEYRTDFALTFLFPWFEKANQLTDLVQILRNQLKVGRELTDQIVLFTKMKTQSD
jgi:hypothetical protein